MQTKKTGDNGRSKTGFACGLRQTGNHQLFHKRMRGREGEKLTTGKTEEAFADRQWAEGQNIVFDASGRRGQIGPSIKGYR